MQSCFVNGRWFWNQYYSGDAKDFATLFCMFRHQFHPKDRDYKQLGWRRKLQYLFIGPKVIRYAHLMIQLTNLMMTESILSVLPITSMVYYPFQAVDLWCTLTDEHMIPSGFVRLILMYQQKNFVLPQTAATSSDWKMGEK